jgi:hypothetical protein
MLDKGNGTNVLLSYNGCRIMIEDHLITCSYRDPFGTTRWQMTLNDSDICYTVEGKKGVSFNVDEIRELQFEMGNGAYRHGDIPAAIAYVILKTDPDPKDFFYFMVGEEYVLLNQTKAHQFCSDLLNHIGNRYGIPVAYKLSIDTKKKQNAIALVPLILIITIILIWLRLRFGN